MWKIIVNQIQNDCYQTEDGLTDDMFLFASRLLPIVNVDLLVVDVENRVLLSWRDDEYCGTGWHIPGGIIRHGETMVERLHKTAVREFGVDVAVEEKPIKISEVFLKQEERSHFISFFYKCQLPSNFDIDKANEGKDETTPGYLKFFSSYPENGIVYSQCHYEAFLRDWFNSSCVGGVS